MATIRKLPSGKWNVQVRRYGHKPVSKSFTSQKDAERWARTIESEIDRGIFVDRSSAESTTLADALERYRLEITPHKKGRNQEGQRISQWLANNLSHRSLAALRPSDFAKYRDDRLSEGVATNTVRLELAIISHLFTVARKEWGIAIQNPIQDIRKPKQSNSRNRRLEGDEYHQLLKACQASSNPQLAPLFILAIETGMRLGELLGMAWDDVDLSQRTIHLTDTKNGSSRTVPLTQLAAETLRGLPRHIQQRRVFYRWAYRSDAINGAWRRALRKAGAVGLRFHDLRHEAVSRFFELGLNPLEVASISGHKSMQMLSRYTHLTTSRLIAKLDYK